MMKNLRFRFRTVDLLLLVALAVFGVSGWTGIRPFRLPLFLTLLGTYFFDSTENKKAAWLMLSAFAVFYLTSRTSTEEVDYSFYIISQLGIMTWLFIQAANSRALRIVIAMGLFVFAFCMQALSLAGLGKSVEITGFIWMQVGLALVPLVIERRRLANEVMVWRLMVFQQFIVRVFFIYWATYYRYEIPALRVFSENAEIIMAAALFVPYMGLLNWKNAKWPYLHQSMVTLLVIFAFLRGNTTAKDLAVFLALFEALFSLNRIFTGVRSSALERAVASINSGGFGGFHFLSSLFIIYYSHSRGFPALTMAWDRRVQVAAPAEKRGKVIGHLALQLLTPLWIIWAIGMN